MDLKALHKKYKETFGESLPIFQLSLQGWSDEVIAEQLKKAIDSGQPLQVPEFSEDDYI